MPTGRGDEMVSYLSTDGVREVVAFIQSQRTGDAPFGWQWDGPWPVDQMNERIRDGPPGM